MEVQKLLWLHLGVLFPKMSYRTKGVHFQDVDKWCGEWSKLHHTNVTCRGFAKTLGLCLIMWNMLLVGQLWFFMCTILPIIKWWPWWFLLCSLRTPKLNKSCGQSLMRQCWNTSFQNQISRDSWLCINRLECGQNCLWFKGPLC
jgi:hypothetical protein